jgi:hypothetical protein
MVKRIIGSAHIPAPLPGTQSFSNAYSGVTLHRGTWKYVHGNGMQAGGQGIGTSWSYSARVGMCLFVATPAVRHAPAATDRDQILPLLQSDGAGSIGRPTLACNWSYLTALPSVFLYVHGTVYHNVMWKYMETLSQQGGDRPLHNLQARHAIRVPFSTKIISSYPT